MGQLLSSSCLFFFFFLKQRSAEALQLDVPCSCIARAYVGNSTIFLGIVFFERGGSYSVSRVLLFFLILFYGIIYT